MYTLGRGTSQYFSLSFSLSLSFFHSFISSSFHCISLPGHVFFAGFGRKWSVGLLMLMLIPR